MNKKIIILVVILLIIVVASGIGVYFYLNNNNNVNNDVDDTLNQGVLPELPKEPEIKPGDYVESKMKENLTDERAVAVVVENHVDARPQSGLSEAYMVYEFVVEGGITRYLAIYRDSDASKIGPIRSARHHFFDYIFENDATFVHFGGSTKAYADLNTYNISNMDGMALDGIRFYRDNSRYAPHNAYTNMTEITEYMDRYRTTSDDEGVFKFSSNEVVLKDSDLAEKIKIEYPNEDVIYEYDEENKVYNRFIDEYIDTDRETSKQITVKNIVVQQVEYSTLTGVYAGKGVMETDRIGTGKGYYITEGNMIEITWEKISMESNTVYKDLEGNEIILNDGNTYIQMQPDDLDVTNLTVIPEDNTVTTDSEKVE